MKGWTIRVAMLGDLLYLENLQEYVQDENTIVSLHSAAEPCSGVFSTHDSGVTGACCVAGDVQMAQSETEGASGCS